MSKLYVSVVVVALLALAVMPALAVDLQPTTNAGDPATPFGATLDVTLEVEEYAEVWWDSASLGTITLSGPADFVQDVNWKVVPLNINTNCSVKVTVYEGLSDWVADQGIPAAGIWGQAFTGSNWDELIYASQLQLHCNESYAPSGEGSVYDYGTSTNSPDAGTGVALPDGSGIGSMGEAWLNYDTGKATGPTGPNIGPQPFDGHLTMYPVIGLRAAGGSIGDKDWTDIGADASGTAKVYAVISPLP